MDIIASYQHGRIEQLAEEARGLAGRECDHVQRAIVYHHLYQHSGDRHAYALIAAQAALRLEDALANVEAAAERSWWRIGRARAAALAERARDFAAALRTIDRDRCEAMQLAYRLAHTHGLSTLAEDQLPEELRQAFASDDRRALFLAHQQWVENRWGLALEAAIHRLEWPLRKGAVERAIAALRPGVAMFSAVERRGFTVFERKLFTDDALPRAFAGNPGQHYYRLQRDLADKRRRARAEACDLAADDTVVLAA
ncbi:hypothetical protein H9L12_03065 [Sphingomonas rhizophila]|uniref:Uncharacterized protein n=1 Tax=Sphingomonas rhizophila TaxID=2071607 RepID=A0A7G9SCK1_9SPHN|nr:hypothetical protein [Sphingomonas rhizophila]QNN65576.1 hypothetical protein H9L12_03065 [Sphingomonas rhizophila]